VATQTHDDGFHEIQLNGKQLVFLFMAATVTSVVIFLCGVMVGRSVRAARVTAVEAQEIEQSPTADEAAKVTPPPDANEDVRVNPGTPPPAPVDDTEAKEIAPAASSASPRPAEAPAPAPAVAKAEPPREVVREPAPAPAKPAAPAPAPKTAASAAPPAPADAAPVPTAAPGSGYTVQVAALNVRTEAETSAKRLSSKGYAAYVQTPPGSKNVFRVRVGAYKTRREADAVASRLQKEEQFKPWVTR
jgi:cell division septation protein DedD